ncbi:histidine kinase [Edaphobacter bradus]|uniref:histidine kinase n=1 Tax=Edaphobacter bradus TaxID=2259016 RepID=UPI0021E0F8DC|nr:histidine kinase [Edaphobacter bradus]
MITEVGLSAPAVSLVDEEIRAAVMERLPYEVQFYSEYLETTLILDKGSQNELHEWYAHRYRNHKPDVILALGPSPIKFLARSRKQFFPDTPIVFCGSSKEQADNPVLDSRFTGAWMVLEPEKTIEVALRLRPRTQHVAVVGGTTSYDMHLENLVKTSLRAFQSKLDIIDLTRLDMPSLKSRVRQLPDNTIILYTSIERDSQGMHFFNATQSAPMVAGAANAPTFGLADTLLGHGVVGGYLSSFAAQGRVAAEDTIKILQGTGPQNIPIVQGTSVYMFDWQALKRWGISERNLPLGSVVLYREPTLWEKHKWLVIPTSLVTFVLTLLSGYLLIERRRRRLAETELELEMNFERLISELSTYFIDLPADKVDLGIDSALTRVVGSLAIDRISMLEFKKDGRELQITHSRSVQSSAMLSYSLKSEDLPYLVAKLSKNETLVISDFDQCIEMSAGERESLRGRGERASVFVPLKARVSVLGVLAFVSQRERQWSEEIVEQCKMLGQTFANALVRKRADEALLTSELLKSAILASLSSDVAVVDRSGNILGTNSQVEREACPGMVSEAEFHVGANCLEIYQRMNASNPVAGEILTGINAVLQGEQPQFEIEWSQQSPHGRQWFLTSVTPLKTSEGGAVITRSEITNRKQAEEERLELSGRLIDLQEKERSRLARELHDDFNQRLAVLAIDLERAAQTVSDSPIEASQRLHELWNRASEIGADLHSLSHRLHSSTLESLGLVLGVSSLCGEFAEQHGIQVDFTHENIPRSVPPDIGLCLFRVTQEGLRNMKRHSGVSRAEVRLEGTEQAIWLSIADKGRGFDLSRARTGLGIRSMQERLRLLGGRFEIRSQPGEGTEIHVLVPLAVKANHMSYRATVTAAP